MLICKVLKPLVSTNRIPGFEHKHLQVVLDGSSKKVAVDAVFAAVVMSTPYVVVAVTSSALIAIGVVIGFVFVILHKRRVKRAIQRPQSLNTPKHRRHDDDSLYLDM